MPLRFNFRDMPVNRMRFVKKLLSKILSKYRKAPVPEPLFINVAGLQPTTPSAKRHYAFLNLLSFESDIVVHYH